MLGGVMDKNIQSKNKSVKVSIETKTQMKAIANKYKWKYTTIMATAIDDMYNKLIKGGE